MLIKQLINSPQTPQEPFIWPKRKSEEESAERVTEVVKASSISQNGTKKQRLERRTNYTGKQLDLEQQNNEFKIIINYTQFKIPFSILIEKSQVYRDFYKDQSTPITEISWFKANGKELYSKFAVELVVQLLSYAKEQNQTFANSYFEFLVNLLDLTLFQKIRLWIEIIELLDQYKFEGIDGPFIEYLNKDMMGTFENCSSYFYLFSELSEVFIKSEMGVKLLLMWKKAFIKRVLIRDANSSVEERFIHTNWCRSIKFLYEILNHPLNYYLNVLLRSVFTELLVINAEYLQDKQGGGQIPFKELLGVLAYFGYEYSIPFIDNKIKKNKSFGFFNFFLGNLDESVIFKAVKSELNILDLELLKKISHEKTCFFFTLTSISLNSYKLKDINAAMSNINQALEIFPYNFEANYLKACLLYIIQENELCLEQLHHITRFLGKSGDYNNDINYLKFNVLIIMKKYVEAFSYLNKVNSKYTAKKIQGNHSSFIRKNELIQSIPLEFIGCYISSSKKNWFYIQSKRNVLERLLLEQDWNKIKTNISSFNIVSLIGCAEVFLKAVTHLDVIEKEYNLPKDQIISRKISFYREALELYNKASNIEPQNEKILERKKKCRDFVDYYSKSYIEICL